MSMRICMNILYSCKVERRECVSTPFIFPNPEIPYYSIGLEAVRNLPLNCSGQHSGNLFQSGTAWFVQNRALSSILQWLLFSFKLCSLLPHMGSNSKKVAGLRACWALRNLKGLYYPLCSSYGPPSTSPVPEISVHPFPRSPTIVLATRLWTFSMQSVSAGISCILRESL